MGPLIFTQIVPETKLRTTLALAHYTKPTIANQRLESTIESERKLLGNQGRHSTLLSPLFFPTIYCLTNISTAATGKNLAAIVQTLVAPSWKIKIQP